MAMFCSFAAKLKTMQNYYLKLRAALLAALLFSCCLGWATQQKSVMVLGDTICEVHIDLTGDDVDNKRNPFKRSPSVAPIVVTIVDRILHCYTDEGTIVKLKVLDSDDDKMVIAEYHTMGQSYECIQLPDFMLPGVYFIEVLADNKCYKGPFLLENLYVEK